MVRDKKGRFAKGVSGNPGGRPKADFDVNTLIDACYTEDDWIAALNAMKQRFRSGNIKVVEFIMDRRFGKPTQRQEHTGADGGAIIINWTEVIGDND